MNCFICNRFIKTNVYEKKCKCGASYTFYLHSLNSFIFSYESYVMYYTDYNKRLAYGKLDSGIITLICEEINPILSDWSKEYFISQINIIRKTELLR